MSLNREKVKKYLAQKIEHYKAFYPQIVEQGITTSVDYGSFGACLISIKGALCNIDYKYVSNYSAIDGQISEFFVCSQGILEQRAYQREVEDNKKGMSGTLHIYADGELVNTFEFKEARAVKNELLKILMSDKRRKVKTTYKPLPYSNDIKIVQKWDNIGTTLHQKYRYVYHFKNIDF